MKLDLSKTKFRGNRRLDIVDKPTYDLAVENLCDCGNSFSVLKTPSTTEISIHGTTYGVCLVDNAIQNIIKNREMNGGFITNNVFRDSMIEITRDIFKNLTRILRTGEITEIKKTRLYPEEKMDYLKWKDLPRNAKMYMMDIDRQYWYSAFILGYISENIFKWYEYDDDYKEVCNVTLGRLCSQKEVSFYINGEPFYETVDHKRVLYKIRSNYYIDNEKPLLHIVYSNIVNSSMNVIDSVSSMYKDQIYGCGRDNIYLPIDKTLMHKIGDAVRSFGYNCKFEVIYKHSDTQIRVIDDIDDDGAPIWGAPREMNFFNLPSNRYNNSSK